MGKTSRLSVLVLPIFICLLLATVGSALSATSTKVAELPSEPQKSTAAAFVDGGGNQSLRPLDSSALCGIIMDALVGTDGTKCTLARAHRDGDLDVSVQRQRASSSPQFVVKIGASCALLAQNIGERYEFHELLVTISRIDGGSLDVSITDSDARSSRISLRRAMSASERSNTVLTEEQMKDFAESIWSGVMDVLGRTQVSTTQ